MTTERDHRTSTFLLSVLIYFLFLFSFHYLGQSLKKPFSYTSSKVRILSRAETEKVLKDFEPKPLQIKQRENPKQKLIDKPSLSKARGLTKPTSHPVESEQGSSAISSLSLLSGALPQKSQRARSSLETSIAKAPQETKGLGLISQALSSATKAGSQKHENGDLFQIQGIQGNSYQGGLAQKVKGKRGLTLSPNTSDFEIRGGLSPEIIQAIVDQHMIEIRRCYEQLLFKDPGLEGDVLSQWVIDAKGRVLSVESSTSDLSGSELIPCMDQKIKGWKFPKPEGGSTVNVSFPFRFHRLEDL